MADVQVGATLPEVEMTSTLTTSVLYAGASGDMNPLHYDPAFAADVSPTGDVIAHGMFSMGLASRAVLLGTRSFCTYVCPYGAVFGLADRFSLAGLAGLRSAQVTSWIAG